MRIVIFTLIFSSFLTSAFGQLNIQTNIPKGRNGDTTLWYNFRQKTADSLKLPRLVNCTESFYFRIWTNGQVLDFWLNENRTYCGLLTNYIYKFWPEIEENSLKEKRPPKILSDQVPLDTLLARKTINYFKTISFIPSQDSIKGWGFGSDGVSYCFELLNSRYYSFKTYWTPTAQDSTLIEAKKIQTFVDSVTLLNDLKTEYEKFFATLEPEKHYTIDGHDMIYKFTKEQEKAYQTHWEKDRTNREYLESINDTLNNYLSEKLTKILISEGFSCTDQFFLEFSSKNDLIRIRTNAKFIKCEDKKNYMACKRKIKKAFRQISLNFVKCQRNYNKELHFFDNKILIY